MHAWVIRRERHGRPSTAMQLEQVPVPEIDSDEVLVLVMAAGVNYNGIWAGLGEPVSPFDIHKQDFHVARIGCCWHRLGGWPQSDPRQTGRRGGHPL